MSREDDERCMQLYKPLHNSMLLLLLLLLLMMMMMMGYDKHLCASVWS